MKKLSLIIATFNSAKYLAKSLGSVPLYFARQIEVLIVDGGSTDKTLQVVEASGLDVRIVRQQSRGIYGALNEGVAAAATPWVMFLHSDDIWCAPPSLDSLQGDTSATIWVGDVVFLRESGHILYRRRMPRFPQHALRVFPFILHPNAIYPRDLLLAHPYDEKKYGRKADMYQIAALGSKVRFRRSPAFCYGFRIHDMSTTSMHASREGETLMFWAWRVYVFIFFENNRLRRIISFVKGHRAWSAGPQSE